MKTNNLGTYIYNFFYNYSVLKGLSRCTILSYRDTIKLFLTFTANYIKKQVTDLTVTDFNPARVILFLDYLEKQRRNSTTTRNIRLACLHSFFGYLAKQDPLIFDCCQRILSIPFKRVHAAPAVEYLDREEMKAILSVIERNHPDGFRDYTLFYLMYNTGARVQEIINLRTNSFRLERPFQVRISGKGNKERICPLWTETTNLLRSLLKQKNLYLKSDVPIFVNHRGETLTRFGVRYLLTKYVRIAAKNCLSLEKKHIHPHTIRHSAAMGLLESGVDINTIRAWLGHVNLKTTNRYAEINIEMKRKALNEFSPIAKIKTSKPWKQNHCILQWLDTLNMQSFM